jgi:hypothetical protein
MKSRYLISLIAATMLAVPAVPASQPEVTLSQLQPQVSVTPVPFELALLLLDPHQPAELSIELPRGFTTLEAELSAALPG